MSKKIIPKLLTVYRPSRLPKKNDKYDSLNKSESIKSKVSTAIMNLLWLGKLRVVPSASELTRDGGVALRTYLLNREDLRKEFLNAGYIEGREGDYGLVKKAVGNRDIPIYQREPDAAKREDLVPIGNINSMYYPKKGKLIHAGHYPTALYYNYKNNKLYLKAWDLNDYGGSSGHTPLLKFGANILDKIGSPTVVTSGFLEISNDTLRDYHETLSPFIKKFFKSKGLIYDYLEPTDVNPTIYLPEVTIIGKNKNKFSNSNSDLIYIEGIGLVNKSKRTFQKGGSISDKEQYDRTVEVTLPEIIITPSEILCHNTVLKHQQGGIIDRSPLNFVKNDNTRVTKPIILEKIPYKLKSNEFYFIDKKIGKRIIGRSKQEVVSSDNRTINLRKQDLSRTKLILKKLEAYKNYNEGLKTISTLSTLAMPSTYIGPVFNNNGKSYLDNVISREGTGNTAGNLAIDLAMPFGFRLFNKGISYPYKLSRGTLAIKSSSKSSYMDPSGIKITPGLEIELKYPIYRR